MNRGLRLIPILLLVWLVSALAWRLIDPPSTAVPSQLVERAVPQFQLPPALAGKPGLRSSDLAAGSPKLVNIFASWCVPCAAEAPVLAKLKSKGVRIDAIAVRDTPEALAAFLSQYGDPYDAIGSDVQSSVQIDLGSSGVPETFIVDGHGVIRRQYVGPLSVADIPQVLRQLAELKR